MNGTGRAKLRRARRQAAKRPTPANLRELAYSLEGTGQRDELPSVWERLAKLEPGNFEAPFEIAKTLADQGRWALATDWFARALRLEPSNPQLLEYLGRNEIRRGNFDSGFQLWESRLQMFDFNRMLGAVPVPLWLGGNLGPDWILILTHEQGSGLGDVLQFVRYLPEVVRRLQGGRLEFICPSLLKEFLGRNFAALAGIHIVPVNQASSILKARAADPALAGGKMVRCGLRSLPHVLGPTSWPDKDPTKGAGYLAADPAKVQAWRERLSAERGFKIGVSWTGRSDHYRNDLRSFPLSGLVEALRRESGLEHVKLYSLQLGEGKVAKECGLVDVTSELATLEDTAGLISALDLVISLDGMLAHLSGALGLPVWVLVDVNPHYIWGIEGFNPPWYASARVFRQRSFKDWGSVFDEVARELVCGP